MGSDLHVIVWAPGAAADRLADLAVLRVQLLEACWSRFRPNSELNRLNARAGAGEIAVSDDLHRLVTTCVAAYAWSEGDLDASVLPSMLALGYRHDFGGAAMTFPMPPVPAPGMTQVRVGDSWVALPSGLGLDPGAVGKGLAGDMVTEDILSAGAHAVLVGIGGDVVARGLPPDSDSWLVSMRDDRHDRVEIPQPCGGDLVDPAAALARRPPRRAPAHGSFDALGCGAGDRAGRLRVARGGGRDRGSAARHVMRRVARRAWLHTASPGPGGPRCMRHWPAFPGHGCWSGPPGSRRGAL
jgi:hypothetical protein